MLDYVEGHSVLARLNEALDGLWSFEGTHHEVREDEVVVIGRLSAEGVRTTLQAIDRRRIDLYGYLSRRFGRGRIRHVAEHPR